MKVNVRRTSKRHGGSDGEFRWKVTGNGLQLTYLMHDQAIRAANLLHYGLAPTEGLVGAQEEEVAPYYSPVGWTNFGPTSNDKLKMLREELVAY